MCNAADFSDEFLAIVTVPRNRQLAFYVVVALAALFVLVFFVIDQEAPVAAPACAPDGLIFVWIDGVGGVWQCEDELDSLSQIEMDKETQ